jgi:hypothetical protein
MGVFKKGASSKAQSLGRAERTKEYVSTAKGRERTWRHFSTLPIFFVRLSGAHMWINRQNIGIIQPEFCSSPLSFCIV